MDILFPVLYLLVGETCNERFAPVDVRTHVKAYIIVFAALLGLTA